MTTHDIAGLLPLTDLAFSTLLSLADHDLHGYALIKELRSRTGRANLRTGTVYASLARLQDDGLVTGVSGPLDNNDPRRRYYGITPTGRAALRGEASRLEELVTIAKRKDLLGDPA